MTWVSEKEAIKLLGGVHKRTLRRKSKASDWPITNTNINGRYFQYSKADIDKFLLANSNKARS